MEQLLSRNKIVHNLPTTSTEGGIGPLYWVAGRGDKPGTYLFKAAVYNSTSDMPVTVTFGGSRAKAATLTVLSSQDPNASNYPGGPEVVQTKVSSVVAKSEGVFQFTLPNLSVAVLATM